jgi:hypothetical protein
MQTRRLQLVRPASADAIWLATKLRAICAPFGTDVELRDAALALRWS